MKLKKITNEETIKNEDYFVEQLKNNRNFKVCYMIHNAYWPFFIELNDRFSCCRIDFFGSGVAYLEIANHSNFYKKPQNDYDIIILEANTSNEFYEDNIEYLKAWSKTISSIEKKRVTIGYTRFLPKEKRTEGNTKELNIISYNSESECDYEDKVLISSSYSTFNEVDLLNFVAEKHDSLNGRQSLNRIRK